jgi:type II secretion system protein L
MARRLYVILPQPGEPVTCGIAEGGDIRLVSGEHVPAQPRDEIYVFVPGTEVGCHTVRLPSQPAEQLRRSAAYALEDEMAVAVEDVHVAVGQTSGSAGDRPAFLVDPELLEGWIDRLRSLNLDHAHLVADISVLPATDMLVEAGPHILFASPNARFATDTSLPDDALQALLPAGGALPRLFGASIARRLGRSADAEPDMPLILRLAQWAELQGSLTDLRQGRFAQNSGTSFDLQAWRPLLAGAAGTIVLFLAATALEASALSALRDSLDAQARSIYAGANPGAGVPEDLSASLREQGPSGSAQQLGFLELSALLYEALPDDGMITIQGLRFDAETGRLVASMSYPDYGGDIDIKARLQARMLNVTLGDSRKQDNRVVGDITLEPES